ncbi:MAG: aspartate ammonia-lyase, partial [Gemmatimonadota bacterium]
MPGKVNPVIAESLCQVAAHVIGNDAAVTVGGLSGNFELNVMIPVMTYNVLQSLDLLAASAGNFAERSVVGIEADRERCRAYAERSPALATALAPHLGYDRAAEVAKEALRRDVSIREVVLEKGWMDAAELDRVLDLRRMTEPGIAGKGGV